MRAAGTAERFLESPNGAWVAEGCCLAWNRSPALSGSAIWGRPSEADVERFFVLADACYRAAPGCHVVTDGSRIDSLEATAYSTFVDGVRGRASHFEGGKRRLVLVRPGGLVGGLVEGFIPLAGLRHEWSVFTSAAEAFASIDPLGGAAVHEETERLIEEARGLPPELRRLRDYVRTHLHGARLSHAAAALGMSERTLHRTLQGAKTCFRDELAAARLDAARRLLAETDLKVEEVARRVGHASHGVLTNLFKRTTGQTPAAYREQARGASGRARSD